MPCHHPPIVREILFHYLSFTLTLVLYPKEHSVSPKVVGMSESNIQRRFQHGVERSIVIVFVVLLTLYYYQLPCMEHLLCTSYYAKCFNYPHNYCKLGFALRNLNLKENRRIKT